MFTSSTNCCFSDAPFSRKNILYQKFTMVELLVVIAIIMILAGIMLPVLNKTRQMGMRISCLSNIKQVGLGVISYGMDNKDLILPAYIINEETAIRTNRGITGYPGTPWSYIAAPYLGINEQLTLNTTSPNYTAIPGKYKKGILKCPAHIGEINYIGMIDYGMFFYNIGGHGYDSGYISKMVMSFSKVKTPSAKGMLCDSVYHSPNFVDGEDVQSINSIGNCIVYNSGQNISRLRHANSTNFVFIDGHSANIVKNELRKHAEASSLTDKLLWFGE